MTTKIKKITQILALIGLFAVLGFISLNVTLAAQDLPLTAAVDKVASLKILPAGFYQFNNLEIFKGPVVDGPPATIEVIQKNENSCSVYENGKSSQPLPCVFNDNQSNNYPVQIDERATLLGSSQEPALLFDFAAGEKINILGWLSADGKIIRAAVIRSLASKDFHQSFSGTIKNVTSDGFVLVLSNGDKIAVKTPIVEGAQVTIKGVFDKASNIVSNVLSIFIKPIITLEAIPLEKPEAAPTPAKTPSTLFKNFLKVFGL